VRAIRNETAHLLIDSGVLLRLTGQRPRAAEQPGRKAELEEDANWYGVARLMHAGADGRSGGTLSL
jgi:hypothetical protein